MKEAAFVLGGAVLGGSIGYFAFGWLISQGFYGLVLPGGLMGLGAGWTSCRWRWPSVLCGLLALALGLFAEWQFSPFRADDSFSYFLGHVHQLKPVTLLMIAAGAGIGFWVPFRRVEPNRRPTSQPTA